MKTRSENLTEGRMFRSAMQDDVAWPQESDGDSPENNDEQELKPSEKTTSGFIKSEMGDLHSETVTPTSVNALSQIGLDYYDETEPESGTSYLQSLEINKEPPLSAEKNKLTFEIEPPKIKTVSPIGSLFQTEAQNLKEPTSFVKSPEIKKEQTFYIKSPEIKKATKVYGKSPEIKTEQIVYGKSPEIRTEPTFYVTLPNEMEPPKIESDDFKLPMTNDEVDSITDNNCSPGLTVTIKTASDSDNCYSLATANYDNDFKLTLSSNEQEEYNDNKLLPLSREHYVPQALQEHTSQETTKVDAFFQDHWSFVDERDALLSSSEWSNDQNSPQPTPYVEFFRNHHKFKDQEILDSRNKNIIRSPVCREVQSSPNLCETTNYGNEFSPVSYQSPSTSYNPSKCDSENKDGTSDSSPAAYQQLPVELPNQRDCLHLTPICCQTPKSNIRDEKPEDSPSLKRTYSNTFSDFSEPSYSPPIKNPEHVRKSWAPSENKPLVHHQRTKSLDNLSPVTHLSNGISKYNINRSFNQSPYSSQDGSRFQQKRLRPSLPFYKSYHLQSMESDVGFIDTHCHLDFLFQRIEYQGTYSEYQIENKNTFPKSYRGCVAVFCNPFSFQKSPTWLTIIEEDNVWAAFGCHPHNAREYNEEIDEHLIQVIKHPKVKALGEIGLDYSIRNNCPKEIQQKAFTRQVKLALKNELPIIIHCREAQEDCLNIAKELIPNNHRIHLHCFTDSWDWATEWLSAFPNLFIGLTNLVTYPSAESVHEVARKLPLHRLLLETDAPYFVPRAIGKETTRWSHPGMAIHVAAQIAALKQDTLETVMKAAKSNTYKMYGIQ